MGETKAVVAIDQALIDESVKIINDIVVKTMYKGSLEIGQYLLKHFFNDDIKLASSKNPNKPVSFKALCKRTDLSVHPSTLSRMVRVASQERYFVENSVNTENLSYSHKIEFTKLDNDKKKLQLVKKCITETISCRKLAEDILAIRQKSRKETEPSPLKLITSVDRLIEGTQIATLLSKPEKLQNMRPNTRNDIRERASDLLEKMGTISKDCNKLIKTIEKIEEKKAVKEEKKEREKEERKAKKEKAEAEKEKKKAEEKSENSKAKEEGNAEKEPTTV
jgi:hypothetical protein